MFKRCATFALVTMLVPMLGFAAQGKLIEDRITSSSLEGNLLGDPATRRMMVYLPPSYDTSSSRQYPTVYLLHGFLGNYTFFAWSMNAFAQSMGMDLGLDIRAIADSLIAAGATEEMIIVMPDGLSSYGGGWYERSPVIGNYRDYIARDLVAYIDGKYRTIPNRGSRGISGHSMGGYGALCLAMEYPEVFGAVAAMSPGFPNDFSVPPTPIDGFIAENPDTLGEPVILDPAKDTMELMPIAGVIFTTNFSTNALYAMAAAFSPDPDDPPYYVDLPVRYPEKSIVQDVWERWIERDLVHLIARKGTNLFGTPIFVDQGVGPTVIMPEMPNVDRVVAALREAGLDCTYEEVDGDHLTHLREQVTSALKFLSSHLVEYGAPAASPSSWGRIKTKFK